MLEVLGGSGGLPCEGGIANLLFEVLVKLLNGLSIKVFFLESLLETLGRISGYLVVKEGVPLKGWGIGIDVGEYRGVFCGKELLNRPRRGGVPTIAL